jgi:serine/threonine-protein kinase HipA
MARPRAHIPLNVFLNSRLVGRLNRQSSGAIDFRYDPSWLSWEHALAVSLSLPLREDRYIGAPVIAVFDNLLPDNDSIRRRMAEQVHAEGMDTYSLLAAVGRDCVGALQFLPDGIEPGPAGTVEGKPVSDDEIASILENLASAPLGLSENDDFRISIAGAQEKTALLFSQRRWQKPIGTTATTHIFKPQIGRLPSGIDLSCSVENEFLCLKLTKAFGIPSADVEIATFGDKRVLVVERFDRRWTQDGRLLRLPQEDFCQALSVPPQRKYESDGGPGILALLNLLKASDAPDEDQAMLIKVLVMFWLLGATDGHAKNFSIHLSPGGGFRITPVYDILSAQPNVDAGQIQYNKMKLAMAVGSSRHYVIDKVATRHFVETAAQAGVGASVVMQVFDELRSIASKAIDTVQQALPAEFPDEIANAIIHGFEKRLRQLNSAQSESRS